MRLRFIVPALFTASLSMFGMTHQADACGACIVPPSENTVVTGHRMALSVSPNQTVLWDQIEYAGSPASFAWVLPVKPGAIIQISSDAFFDTLDATTNTQIFQPQITCPSSGGSGFGCGAMADEAGSVSPRSAAEDGSGPAVTVVSRGSVGPYSTVTLSTDVPGALNTWLTMNGFALDPATQPVVDAYIAEGFDFIALKLLPNKDVSAMKPVRVVQQGSNPTLPLRMVGIGTGANVAMTLFLISEGRLEAKDFSNIVVPTNLIAWDFKDSSSNYSELRQKALAENNGNTWLTTFAFQGALLSQLERLPGFVGGVRTYATPGGLSVADTIAGAYVRQAIDGGQQVTDECVQAFGQFAASNQMVTNPCAFGQAFNDPACMSVSAPAGAIDARAFVCGASTMEPLDDVAVALNGLHPKDVWITRIEADLPHASLAHDLSVQPASEQVSIDNLRVPGIAKNVEVVCGTGAAIAPVGTNSNQSGPRGRQNIVVLVGLGLLSLAAFARRRFATV